MLFHKEGALETKNGRNPELPAQPRGAITTKIRPQQLLTPLEYQGPHPPTPAAKGQVHKAMLLLEP